MQWRWKKKKTRLKMFADEIKNSNYSLESNLHGMPLIWWRAKYHGIIDFYQVNKASDAINFSSRKSSTTEWIPLLCKYINIECFHATIYVAQSGGCHWYTVTSGNFSDWFTLELQSGAQIWIQKSIPDSSLLWRLCLLISINWLRKCLEMKSCNLKAFRCLNENWWL